MPLNAEMKRAVEHATAILRRGGLAAFPTETVYGLGADRKTPMRWRAFSWPGARRCTIH